MEDQPPWVVKKIKSFVDEFQTGDFDAMQDMYVNRPNNKPGAITVKYVDVSNKMSDNMAQKIWSFLCSEYANFKDASTDFSKVKDRPLSELGMEGPFPFYTVQDFVKSIFHADRNGNSLFADKFWKTQKSRVRL